MRDDKIGTLMSLVFVFKLFNESNSFGPQPHGLQVVRQPRPSTAPYQDPDHFGEARVKADQVKGLVS